MEILTKIVPILKLFLDWNYNKIKNNNQDNKLKKNPALNKSIIIPNKKEVLSKKTLMQEQMHRCKKKSLFAGVNFKYQI